MNNLRVTDNDLMLFKYLFECDFLTRYQIKKILWEHLNESHVDRRLWRLSKEGYIKKLPDPRHSRKTVLVGDEKALYYLRLRDIRKKLKKLERKNSKLCYINPDFYNITDKLDLRQFDHDRILNTCRFILENYGVNYWVPHLYLHRKKPAARLPDAIFKKSDYIFTLELENTLKQRYRYKDIFKRYARMVRGENIDFSKLPKKYREDEEKEIDGILYIATSKSLFDSLQKLINPKFISYPTGMYKAFYVADIDDIAKCNLKFVNQTSNNTFHLDKI